MKHVFFILLLVSASFPSLAQTKITSEEALNHIGDSVLLIDKVYHSKTLDDGTAILSVGGDLPHQLLTLRIKPQDLPKFSFKPEKRLLGKQVLVKGKVVANNGKPEIVISEPGQLNELNASDPRPQNKQF